jgi:hypothetical protein
VEGEHGILDHLGSCLRRGKWSFYSLDRETAGELLGEAAYHLLSGPEKRSVGGGCC